jgi:cytochrome c553
MSRRVPNPPRLLPTILVMMGIASGIASATAGNAATDDATQDQVMGTVHVCSSCHGMSGRSISPTFPRLAGQQEAYLEAQLMAFRDHTRADPHAHTYMWGMAAHLSDPLIKGLATYFSSQSPAAPTPGDAGLMAAGAKIFREGIPERNVPICMSCHGEHAEGMDTIPRLASQHHDYLVEQLRNFQTKARANDIMDENAKNLTEAEIEQLATYLAAQ